MLNLYTFIWYNTPNINDKLNIKGLSGNTIKHYRANISKALKSAVITEIIDSNPATKLETIMARSF